jgi:hypothetical protein
VHGILQHRGFGTGALKQFVFHHIPFHLL